MNIGYLVRVVKFNQVFKQLFFNLCLIIGLYSGLVKAQALATYTVNSQLIDTQIVLNAQVKAIHNTTLTAQTSGQINQIYVEAGDQVTAGTLLLSLKNEPQKAALESAKANYAAAQAAFTDAKASLQRVTNLRKQNIASQQAFDDATARFDITQAQLQAAKAQVDSAKEQLSYTQVIAPYAGIVLERHVDLGEVVNIGTPLFTGTSLAALRIETQVPQQDLSLIKKYATAKLLTENQNTIEVGANNISYYAYAMAQNGAVKVRIAIPPSKQGWYPGQNLKVAFKTGEKQAILIPKTAVKKRAELNLVYVLDKQNRLHLRQIRSGNLIDAELVEVLSGVTAGERIVVDANQAIAQIAQQGGQL